MTEKPTPERFKEIEQVTKMLRSGLVCEPSCKCIACAFEQLLAEIAAQKKELEEANTDFKNACKEIARLEDSDALRRRVVELEKTVSELNDFDVPDELIKERDSRAEAESRLAIAVEALERIEHQEGNVFGAGAIAAEALEKLAKIRKDATGDTLGEV